MIFATIVEAKGSGQHKFALEAAGIEVSVRLDSNADVDTGRLKLGDTLCCLRLSTSGYKEDLCLILKAVDTTLIAYERVGYLEHNSEILDQNWFQSTDGDVEVRIV